MKFSRVFDRNYDESMIESSAFKRPTYIDVDDDPWENISIDDRVYMHEFISELVLAIHPDLAASHEWFFSSVVMVR